MCSVLSALTDRTAGVDPIPVRGRGRAHRSTHGAHPRTRDWGDPRLKSSALQAQILKSLKSMPRHTFKAPDTNILKSDKGLHALQMRVTDALLDP